MSPTGAVDSTGTVLRTRRYVSAPIGVYPEPIPAPTPAVQGADQAPARAESPSFEPGRTASMPGSPANLDALSAPSTVQSLPPEPQTPASALAASAPAPDPVVMPDPAPAARKSTQAVVVPSRVPRIIAGALIGGVLGAAVGLLLLALTNPAIPLDRLSDPVRLWNETPDPLMQIGAGALTVGFILLGAGMGARPR